jgi:hypothetical protein
MAQELIIGACHRLEPDAIYNWLMSSRSCGFAGDIALISVDTTASLARLCATHDVALIDVPPSDPSFLDHPPSAEPLENIPDRAIRIHHQRYLLLHRYLSQASSYDFVITTDVRDVVFQQDPFPKLRTLLDSGNSDILIGSENMLFKDESWNMKNFRTPYPFLANSVAYEEPVCSGVIGGRFGAIADFLMLIYLVTRNFLSGKVSDQAGVNALRHLRPIQDQITVTGLSEAWVCHLGISGLADDQRDLHYDRHLLESPPVLCEDMVVNAAGKTFDIVHQYDRTPKANERISRKYCE